MANVGLRPAIELSDGRLTVADLLSEPIEPRAEQLESELRPRARDAGFDLVQYETPLGQLVLEWRRGEARGRSS